MNACSSGRTGHFVDRADAARQLAKVLGHYRGQRPLVLAIPRGGVPVGRIIADALGGELDVVLVRKLCSPLNGEVAIGAIDEQGRVQLNAQAGVGTDNRYIRAEAARQLAVIRKRRAACSPGRHPVDVRGRLVIVVDDGLATGATMRAALEAVRRQHPARLVAAVPVAAPRGLDDLSGLADEVICLHVPAHFRAVGAFYQDFQPVEDREVLGLLSAPKASIELPTSESIGFELPDVRLPGELAVPSAVQGLVVLGRGSGSGRLDPCDRNMARVLQRSGMATLWVDLLTMEEDLSRAACFDIATLADRLASVVAQVRSDPSLGGLPLGLFGADTGACAALAVAAERPHDVAAVVARSGRPDLAGPATLARVMAPTLFIVGGEDTRVLSLHRIAQRRMPGRTELAAVPGATHLFEEPGTGEAAADLASAWFAQWLNRADAPRKPRARGPREGRRMGLGAAHR